MIVMDCCAAVAIVRRTPEGDALSALELPGEKIAAPDLLHSELTSALWKTVKAGDLEKNQALEQLADALALVTDMHDSAELYKEAFSEAVRLGHSPYDMFYFVLARRLGATVYTLDKKLIALCEQEGVDVVHPINLPN